MTFDRYYPSVRHSCWFGVVVIKGNITSCRRWQWINVSFTWFWPTTRNAWSSDLEIFDCSVQMGRVFLGWLRLKLLHLLCAKLNPKGHHLTYRTKKTLRTWKFSTFAPAKRVHHDIDLFFLSFCFRTSN